MSLCVLPLRRISAIMINLPEFFIYLQRFLRFLNRKSKPQRRNTEPVYLRLLPQQTIRDTVINDIIARNTDICIFCFPRVTDTLYRKRLVIAVSECYPLLFMITPTHILMHTLGRNHKREISINQHFTVLIISVAYFSLI